MSITIRICDHDDRHGPFAEILAALNALQQRIEEMSDALSVRLTSIETALDNVATGLGTVGTEVQTLQDDITALKNGLPAGTLTPEQTALLDSIDARVAALAGTVSTLTTAAADPGTAPTPPATP